MPLWVVRMKNAVCVCVRVCAVVGLKEAVQISVINKCHELIAVLF